MKTRILGVISKISEIFLFTYYLFYYYALQNHKRTERNYRSNSHLSVHCPLTTVHLIMRFLSDLQNSDENGAEDCAHKHFNEEVSECEGDEYAESRLLCANDLAYGIGVRHKEYRAAEKEDSCIY